MVVFALRLVIVITMMSFVYPCARGVFSLPKDMELLLIRNCSLSVDAEIMEGIMGAMSLRVEHGNRSEIWSAASRIRYDLFDVLYTICQAVDYTA